MDRLDRAFWDHLISFDTPCFSGFFWGAPSDFIRASRRPRYHHFGSYDASSESWSNLMDLDGLKLLLSATSAELAELELKRYHWWLRYYEEWHGEAPRADKNSAVAQCMQRSCRGELTTSLRLGSAAPTCQLGIRQTIWPFLAFLWDTHYGIYMDKSPSREVWTEVGHVFRSTCTPWSLSLMRILRRRCDQSEKWELTERG